MSEKDKIQAFRDQCGDPSNKGKIIVASEISIDELDEGDICGAHHFAEYHGALGIQLKDDYIKI